jgi:hypothetical protein
MSLHWHTQCRGRPGPRHLWLPASLKPSPVLAALQKTVRLKCCQGPAVSAKLHCWVIPNQSSRLKSTGKKQLISMSRLTSTSHLKIFGMQAVHKNTSVTGFSSCLGQWRLSKTGQLLSCYRKSASWWVLAWACNRITVVYWVMWSG